MGLADQDGNGTLNKQELYDFFNQIDGISHNKQIIDEIFTQIDIN